MGIRSLYQEPARRLLFPLAKRSRDICAPEEKELNMYVPIVQQEAACLSAESAVVQYYEETSATCRLQVQSTGRFLPRSIPSFESFEISNRLAALGSYRYRYLIKYEPG
jgi:hypothetical protein